jgi:hypothetical protein
VREAIERGLAAFGCYLDESDPGFIVVCRKNGSFVAAFSAILASVHLPKPRSEQCSYPFTDRFSRHLGKLSARSDKSSHDCVRRCLMGALQATGG